jgi:WD40 repeat protein
VAFAPDGKWLLSRSASGTLMVWDMAGGKELRTLSERVWAAFAISPDGKRLASVFEGGLKMWDTTEWQELCTTRGNGPQPPPRRVTSRRRIGRAPSNGCCSGGFEHVCTSRARSAAE